MQSARGIITNNKINLNLRTKFNQKSIFECKNLFQTHPYSLFTPQLSNALKINSISLISSNIHFFSTLKRKNTFQTTPFKSSTSIALPVTFITKPGQEHVKIIKRENFTVKNELHPKAFLLMLIVGAILAYIYNLMKEEKKKEFERLSVGKPALGGSFTLVDHNGVPFTDLELSGKFYLIYFGFTFCPDICPTELEKMAKVLNALEEQKLADGLIPLMISLDPWRDTVGQLRDYVAQFHPRLVGATGTPDQVLNCAKKFRVYTSKPPEVSEDGEDDYLVDHSIFMYLVGPNGDFLDFFGQDREDEEITHRISLRFKEEYDRRHPSLFNRALFYNEKSSN